MSNTLKRREDDWSIQITSSEDRRLYVRYDKTRSTLSKIVLSDLLLSPGNTELAKSALTVAVADVLTPLALKKVVCENILPKGLLSENRDELIRRHDELSIVLVECFTAFDLAVRARLRRVTAIA